MVRLRYTYYRIHPIPSMRTYTLVHSTRSRVSAVICLTIYRFLFRIRSGIQVGLNPHPHILLALFSSSCMRSVTHSPDSVIVSAKTVAMRDSPDEERNGEDEGNVRFIPKPRRQQTT